MVTLTDDAPLEPNIGGQHTSCTTSNARRVITKKSLPSSYLFPFLLVFLAYLPSFALASPLQYAEYHDAPTTTTVESFRKLTLRAAAEPAASTCRCGEAPLSSGQKAAYGILVPILILLSGLFAGLTLGYMSLDETQLQVLAAQGTEKQKKYASKIVPVRKDGHLLLTTLLIANMITNETLPIITDPLLGGGLPAVVFSIVVIVIFAELIPQSICSRYGLVVGAYMAYPTRAIMFVLWPIAWPVSRVLHWTLGPHQGLIYRRAELKELVQIHAAAGGHGGDLKGDTVMIVGGALDLQEKSVKDAMTPIEQVFMLSFDAKLDYPTLEKVVRSGHSRIPIYQDIDVPVAATKSGAVTPSKKPSLLSTFTRKSDGVSTPTSPNPTTETISRRKIIGTLLVKSCVLLDPEDAVPVADMVINTMPTIPQDEPILNLLNVFQEGRSHMAVVSSRTRRGLAEDMGSKTAFARKNTDLCGIDEESAVEGSTIVEKKRSRSNSSGSKSTTSSHEGWKKKTKGLFSKRLTRHETMEQIDIPLSRQSTKAELDDVDNTTFDVGHPVGIITLEDVLEELLQSEIYDEYDAEGGHHATFSALSPPPSPEHQHANPIPLQEEKEKEEPKETPVAQPKTVLQRLGLQRQRSSVAKLLPYSTEGTNSLSTEPEEFTQSTGTDEASDRERASRDIRQATAPANISLKMGGAGAGGKRSVSQTRLAQSPLRSPPISGSGDPMTLLATTSRPANPSSMPASEAAKQPANVPQAAGLTSSSGGARPVIVKAQIPGENKLTTAIVNEQLLMSGRARSIERAPSRGPPAGAAERGGSASKDDSKEKGGSSPKPDGNE